MSTGYCSAVEVTERLSKALTGESGEERRTCCRADPQRPADVTRESAHHPRDRINVPWGDEQAAAIVTDDLADGANGGRNHRQPERHRLDVGEAKTLGVGRHHERVGGRKDVPAQGVL